MTIERLLQLNIAAMAVLGTTVFAMGHPEPSIQLPLLAMFVAATSVVFTDGYNWFHLNRVIANCLAIAIFLYTGYQFIQAPTGGEKLLEVANLLAYLQFVLFFEVKGKRTYAHLMVLSLLQVVVASALHLLLLAGLLLMAYVVIAITSALLFFLYCEGLRVTEDMGESQRLPELVGRAVSPRPTAVFLSAEDPYVNRIPQFGLIRTVSAIAFTAFALAMVSFYSLPRENKIVYTGASGALPTDVGFEPEIELGDEFTTLLQSNEQVMRIGLFDGETDVPYTLNEELYVRGTVLVDYDYENANWRVMNGHRKRHKIDVRRTNLQPLNVVRQEIVLSPRDDDLLFGVYPALQVSDTTDEVKFDFNRRQLFRNVDETNVGGQYRYTLGTIAIQNGRQNPITSYSEESFITPDTAQMDEFMALDQNGDQKVTQDELPEVNPLDDSQSGGRTRFFHSIWRRYQNTEGEVQRGDLWDLRTWRWQKEVARLLQFDQSRFPRLQQVAAEVLRRKETDRTNFVQIAYDLRDYLLESETFSYTLNFESIERDERLDPIEDFVANHRRGHCEYFASALTMMLRSQGVPARIVIGYKGGDFNALGNYYQIKEKHAHAWVEAYLAPERVSERMRLFAGECRGGVWLRLDPTPAIRYDKLTFVENPFFDRFSEFADYCGLLWSDYVIGYNSIQQQRTMVALRQGTRKQIEQHVPTESTEVLAAKETPRTTQPVTARFLFWPAVSLIVLCGVLLCVVLRRKIGPYFYQAIGGVTDAIGRFAPDLARWILRLSRADSPKPIRVDFYDQMVAIFSLRGLHRSESQTQREFAESLYHQLNGSPERESVAKLPRQIVDAFYRVRFGGAELDCDERSEIEQSLATLRESLD